MTDTKLDPATLTSEERAIVEELVTRDQMFWPQTDFGNALVMDKPDLWKQSYDCAFARILARRALFSPAAESARCRHSHGFHGDVWECQRESGHSGGHECKSWSELGKKGAEHPEPDWRDLDAGAKLAAHFAQVPARDLSANPADWTPAPAAPIEMPEAARFDEMPSALHLAWLMLDVDGQQDTVRGRSSRAAAVGLRDWWRTHAQSVGITPELERVLAFAKETTEMRDPSVS